MMRKFKKIIGLVACVFMLAACREIKSGKTDLFNSVYYSSPEATVEKIEDYTGANYQESTVTIQGLEFTKYEFDNDWIVYENDRGKTAAVFLIGETFTRQELDDLLVDFDILLEDLEKFDNNDYETDYLLAESNNNNVYRLYLEVLGDDTYRFAPLYNLPIIEDLEINGYPE